MKESQRVKRVKGLRSKRSPKEGLYRVDIEIPLVNIDPQSLNEDPKA